MRILAITRKPDSASFEQRVLRFAAPLAERGLVVEWKALPATQRGQYSLLGEAKNYDGVWWHRHLISPWWVGRLRANARRLVFDFDDPLIYTSAGGGKPSAARRMRFGWLLKKCDAAFAASNLLAELSRPLCPATHVVPMAIDVPPRQAIETRWNSGEKQQVELLWLGSSATQPYLEVIRADLEALGARLGGRVKLRLVAHNPMAFGALKVDFRQWTHDEQERALLECDIGLCPMPDTVWTRGKCPFKVLQYMAYGMSWVGSAVGENLVTSGATGGAERRGVCVSQAPGAWASALEELVRDTPGRAAVGRAARAYIEATHDRVALVKQIENLWRGLERLDR